MATQVSPGQSLTAQPPIPEPAPELCAWAPCAVGDPDCAKQAPGTREEHSRRKLRFPGTHDFVAPHAKPVSAGALQNLGSIGPSGDLIPAKPVLREPKLLPVAGEVWAYAGHEIGEVSKVVNEKIYGDTLFFSNDHPPLFWNGGNSWARVRPAKPAAKDIPSADGGMGDQSRRLVDTEAARGGEAAISSRCVFCGTPGRHRCPQLTERGPSAVAAAPAIEPWRPSVDDFDLLADAETGWRR